MMKKKVTNVLVIMLLLLTASSSGVFAQAAHELAENPEPAGPVAVASTSWVAAMAEAAGLKQVTVLAPVELKHPPEYDFRPSDVMRAATADIVLWAGYEAFVKELVAAADIDAEKIILVSTNNAPDVLRKSVGALAESLGTKEAYAVWTRQLTEFEQEALTLAKQHQTDKIRVAVQFHHQQFARWLGYDVVSVFGPNELTIGQLQDIESKNPSLIIDNWHNPSGQMLATNHRTYVQLINFPGLGETKSLLDVLRYNIRLLGLY